MIVKLSIHQDNKDKWHVFASEKRASKYMKQKRTELKGKVLKIYNYSCKCQPFFPSNG